MASLILKNGKVIDVVNKRITTQDVYISDGKITESFPEDQADKVIDLDGSFVSPGFIDGHLHIESSLLAPIEFACESVRYGTTSVFVDPHEIANVLGRKGIELFLDSADLVPFNMHIGVPSCVPATKMETSGGKITLKDIKELLKDDRVYGLAEMMNVPGIVQGLGDARHKVRAALEAGKIVDGHCPGLTGEDLLIYISNGGPDWGVRIGSDHECTDPIEAMEKWEHGMYIMLRYGSAAKDLEHILPEVCRREVSLERFGLVSDDLSAVDLRRRGHINYLVEISSRIIRAIKGFSREEAVIEAICMATINHAKYFKKNTGQITIGYDADVIVLDSLEEINAQMVFVKGKLVSSEEEFTAVKPEFDYSKYDHPIKVADNLPEKLILVSNEDKITARVIGAQHDSLITDELHIDIPVVEGIIRPEENSGICKIAVLERHRGTHNIAVGFVKGFDFIQGAIASTVAHDSHNLVVVGTNETAMIKAIDVIKRSRGGLAAISSKSAAVLPLDLAGLMSTKHIGHVLQEYERLEEFFLDMGFREDPFPTLSFMALPVIPKLKITDTHLVDTEHFNFVDLIV